MQWSPNKCTLLGLLLVFISISVIIWFVFTNKVHYEEKSLGSSNVIIPEEIYQTGEVSEIDLADISEQLLYENDALDLSYLDLDVESELVAIKEYERRERQRELIEKVSQESIQEKTQNLLYTYCVGGYLLEGVYGVSDQYISSLDKDPRVKSLIEIAKNGSDQDKKEILRNLTDMCEVYLELPLLGEPGEPWKPTIQTPGGAEAYPYLLTYVDEDAISLDVLVKMYLRKQEAFRLYFKAVNNERFNSKDGLVFAYSCKHFLDIYNSRLDLKEKLIPSQLEVLKDYTDYLGDCPAGWDIEEKQCNVMDFAISFVEKGAVVN